VQSNLVAIRAFLRKNGNSCAVINITRHRKPEADDVYYPENAAQLIGLLRRLQYDVLHLHLGGMLTFRLLALGLACTLLRGSKSVLTFHSGGYPSTPEAQSLGPKSLAGFVLRRFDGLIAVNPEILHFFHKLGVSANNTRLIYPHAFLAEDGSSGSLPEPLHSFFARHSPVLISVGLLEPEYDLPTQIQVLGQVRLNFQNAGLVLIGSGSLEHTLRNQIDAQPYAEHILLCGDVPHSATLQAIVQSQLMLRTTLYDGDAVSVREALHVGTAVIATDNGMRPPGLRLIPKSNMPALLRAINEQLNAPTSRSGRVPSAADESNLQAVRDLYEQLLKRP
jgi:glycosyltransferase involved in cell wall biosynthesis